MTLDPKQIVLIADIPPIPQLLHQIMSLADNPSTTIQKLESLVNQEPAMITKILKWVNSALYSFPNKISSVKHAMIILGFSTVRSIASGLALMNAFENIPGINKEQVLSIWKQGLEAAQYAKILAAKEKSDIQDIIYLSAMIQNVGEIVLSQYFNEKYTNFISVNLFPHTEDENTQFETNHAIVGAALLTEWRFSDTVCQIVLNHHEKLDESPFKKELTYITIANRLTELSMSEDTWRTDFLCDTERDFLNITNEYLLECKPSLLGVPKAVKLILE